MHAQKPTRSLCYHTPPHLFAVVLGIRWGHHKLASVSKAYASTQKGLGLRIWNNVEKVQRITCRSHTEVDRCVVPDDAKCLVVVILT